MDSFALFESSCIPEECFRTVEYLQLDSHKHYVPQGSIIINSIIIIIIIIYFYFFCWVFSFLTCLYLDTVSGFCPKTTDEQNYLSFFFTVMIFFFF